MRLNKLILQGFKSFVDRTEIVFDSGITGIVGPNGCGKSNIADAVRWVLGEQSARTLRGSKMEDVIFNGSEKRRRLSFCEVTLVFDNPDHALPVDYAEVAVTRRVYRSGEGEYKINGNACRLKDIIDLFRDTGVGKEGYSLIGQGRIDDILSQKSEDRRQVFEEAAGIGRFKARKTDAERRLQRTEENLTRIDDICDGLEERIGPLETQSADAREYLALRDELKVLELNIFLARYEKYEPRIADAAKKLEELREELESFAEKQKSLEEARAINHAEFEQFESETAAQNETVQELIREVEALEGQVRVTEEKLSSAKTRSQELTRDTETLKQGVDGVRERISSMSKEIDRRKILLKEAESTQARLDADLDRQETCLTELEEEAEEKKQSIIKAMSAYGDVKVRRERIQTMLNMLSEQIQHAEAELKEHKEKKPGLIALEAEATAKAQSEREKKAKLQDELVLFSRELNERRAESEKARRDLEELNTELARLRSTQKILLEMQRDYEGYYSSVKQVMLQAKRSKLTGVHGVIADVLRVPQEYERAIDMALGNSLQYVIVDDAEDAKGMIEYLRTNRYGRATFYPISAIRRRDMSLSERKVLNMKGCLGVASELIGYDAIYSDIISNLLGRTVIARDLDSGIAIQKAGNYQFRVVTLQGDVMHSGGSLTGGSVQSKATSLLSRQREIAQTTEAIQKAEEKLKLLQEVCRSSAQAAVDLEKSANEHKERLHDQDLVSQRADDALASLYEEKKAYSERGEALESNLEGMAEQRRDLELELEKLQSQSTEAKASTAEQQAEVRALQEKIYSMREDTEKLRKETGDSRVALTGQQKDLASMSETYERFVKEAGDSDAVLARRGDELKHLQDQIGEYEEKLSEERASASEHKRSLDDARSEYRISEDKRVTALQKEQEYNDQLEKLRSDIAEAGEHSHRFELQKARMEQEFKQIQDRIWEDYQLSYAGAKEYAVKDFKLTESDKRAGEIKRRIREMGVINVAAIDEYRQVSERLQELNEQRSDLRSAREDLLHIITDLETRMQRQFRTELEKINENFKRTFTALFGGGAAEISLTDPKEALTCGIDIEVQPPGKRLQMLSLLSGGERALTAIAILFAILDLKPTPFCLLDEIEAALDDANIDTYADYLQNYSRSTQFIVITHRKGTMQRCNSLYGIVMEEKGISKTVSVSLNEAVS